MSTEFWRSRDEVQSQAEKAVGDLDYGKALNNAMNNPGVDISRATTIVDAPLFSRDVNTYTVMTAFNPDEKDYTVFLTVTQGEELRQILIGSKVAEAIVRKVKAAKQPPMTAERKARKEAALYRKRGKTIHAFEIWPTVAGKCKYCRKGKNTEAHNAA
tara:strand:+ start:4594 stop:5067 length:474 start_codon:yes stop_codon:yes gene_type:complete